MTPAALRPLLSQVAWSHVLIFFDFNLGSFDLLADFIGWFLLAGAVRELAAELPDLGLLRPLALGLGWYEVFSQAALLFGWDLEEHGLTLLILLFKIVRVYFDFQLFTNLAQLAARYQPPDRKLDRGFLRVRNLQVFMDTLLSIPVLYPTLNEHQGLLWVLLGASVVVMAVVLYCLFSLRDLIPEDGAPAASPPR